jgi:hypothetical protein
MRVQGSGFRVQGSRNKGSGFRVRKIEKAVEAIVFS